MKRQVRIAAMLCSAAVLVHGAPARAQANAAESRTRDFDVPAQPLAQAVLAFSQQAGVQLVLESGTAEGMNSSPVKGHMSVAEAITRLLAGTSLTWRFVNDRTITIEAAPQGSNGEHVLGAVRVEGEQRSPYFGGAGQSAGVNGVNGSRDITATEGTKSFTSGALTVGSKVPQAMKDVPQSLSVLTSEQMKQQNVTDFTGAMRQLPGVTLVQGSSSLENSFYSRGFQITNIQVDGGAPLSTNNGFYPQIDMSVYDHVELVRGANGLFDGNGDPSGTINLVRKKPLDHSQVEIEGQAGSWDTYRVMADATAPLALDGRLRGRLVMTWQSNHHFYDIAKDNKKLIYGIAEFDATPTTLLTAGINDTRQDSVPWFNGLPRYLTGADLQLPRSIALAFPWNRWNFDTTEIFGGVEQKIADDWKLKVNLTRNRQTSTEKIGYSNGAVNPINDSGPRLRGLFRDTESKQFSAEAVLTGAFIILGQRQEVTVGANRVSNNAGGTVNYLDLVASSIAAPYQPYPGGPRFCFTTSIARPCPAGTIGPQTPPIDVFNFDPNDPLYTEPANPLPNFHYLHLGTVQTAAYANLRLTAFDRLHLAAGLRWSSYVFSDSAVSLCTTIPASGSPGPDNCVGRSIGDPFQPTQQGYRERHFNWPPSVSLSFDVTRQLTAYAGYTDIFQSQANEVTSDLKPLGPTTGSNYEGGLKWAPHDGKLNLSLSVYRIRQKGFAILDPNNPNFQDLGNGISCCYISDPNQTLRSQGLDFEATGEILPGWQVAASYNRSSNKQEGSTFGASEGLPFTTIQPKNIYKLWTSYDFSAVRHGGLWSGLTVSAGIIGQSSAYFAGSTCVNPIAPPPPPGNSNTCVSFNPPDFVNFNFTVPGYVVASARIDYRLSPNWSFALNIDNIFDKTYYQTVGSTPASGNWYGPPRSFTATLQAKW